MGKSSLLHSLASWDLRYGHGLAVIDPNGDLVEGLLDMIGRTRIGDVVYFDPSDLEWPIGLNILTSVDPDHRHLVADQIISVFKHFWGDSWGPRLENILRYSLMALLEVEGSTLLGLHRLLTDKAYRAWVADQVHDPQVQRFWTHEFASEYANQLRRRRLRPGDKWHLDEVFLTIHGKRHYLWRAVDQDGHVLDILVQRRRDKKAAKTFFRKLLKGCQYAPRVIVTDKLKSYGAAKRELLPGVEHRQHRYLNNRAENSHQPTRQREWRMQGFKSAGHAQRFLSAYGLIAQHFRPRRHLLSASSYRQERRNRFERWAEITGTEQAA